MIELTNEAVAAGQMVLLTGLGMLFAFAYVILFPAYLTR